MSILLIEDDERIVEFVRRGLEAEGYRVEWAGDGEGAIRRARESPPDLAVLDLMLPDVDGIEVCRRLRATGMTAPILMLTARDTLEDKVEGLRSGADDYLTKPFAFEELLARIQALLRRGGDWREAGTTATVGDLTLDRETREVRRGERRIELTAKEFALLDCLMSRPGKVFSRAMILQKVWGYSTDPLTNVVEVYIRQLRKKIDDGEPTPLIHTSRGFGYKVLDR